MEADHDARSLLITKESRFPTLGAYSLTLLLMLVTVGDFMGELETTSEFTSNTPEWRITFEIQNETIQTVETVQDDETRNILFDLSEITISDGFFMGYLDVLILPEEQDGDDDWGQCDSISADIIENQLTAQWNDPSNDLSGQDSSCLPFELNLRVYPNFSGDPITVSAINEYQALQNWTETGWGHGDLSIELDLDVNTPLGLNSPTDSDEEITVEVTVVMFATTIQKI